MEIGSEVKKKIGHEISKIKIDEELCDEFRGELESGECDESIQIRQYFGLQDFNGWFNDFKKLFDKPIKQIDVIKVAFTHCDSHERKFVETIVIDDLLRVAVIYFAFYKHPDGKADIIYAIYALEDKQRFTYIEEKLPTKRLGGLYSKEKTVVRKVFSNSSKFQKIKAHKGCDHYFRLKAVEAFLAEGLVERGSLEHIQGIRDRKVLHVEPYPDELRENNQSYRFLQDALCSIEYNSDAASLFEQKIKAYKSSNWQENMIMQKYIGIYDFPVFIQDLNPFLELDEKNILEMECMYKYASAGQVNKMEFSYGREGLCTRYVFFALSKHSCNSKSDFVFAQYELKAEKNRSETDEDSPRSLFWGAIKYNKTRKYENAIDLNDFEDLKNDPNRYDYCRKRVLDECIVDRVVQLPKDGSPIVVHF